MTDDKQTIDGMKEEERLKIEIPVEEYDEAGKGNAGDGEDVVRQLRDSGRQMGETLRLAWEAKKSKRSKRKCAKAYICLRLSWTRLSVKCAKVMPVSVFARKRTNLEQVQTGDFGRKVAGGLLQALVGSVLS